MRIEKFMFIIETTLCDSDKFMFIVETTYATAINLCSLY